MAHHEREADGQREPEPVRPEQLERHHRVRHLGLDDDEPDQGCDSNDHGEYDQARAEPGATALVGPATSVASPTTARTCPVQSNGCGRFGEVETHTRKTSIATQNRQVDGEDPAPVVRREQTAQRLTDQPGHGAPTAQTPSALARRPGSGKASRTRAIDAGSMIAAPAPWAHRAATRSAVLGAMAHAAEVIVKIVMPIASDRFAPIRSARLPANRRSAANRACTRR